jgi:hypothetical protein
MWMPEGDPAQDALDLFGVLVILMLFVLVLLYPAFH